MSHSPPLLKVALLGRPNVGKSTLFNRLIRSQRAITHDRPGITRDRMEGVVRARGEEDFALVDTGGLTLDSHERVTQGPEGIRGFETEILAQARQAVGEAQLLCLVVDAREGLIPLDRHLADFLRKQGRPLLLVVNKVDGPEQEDLLLAEFHGLGLDMCACSAAHGYNVRVLEDEIRHRLFSPPPLEDAEPEPAEDDDGILFAGASRRQKKRLRASLADAHNLDGAGQEKLLPEETGDGNKEHSAQEDRIAEHGQREAADLTAEHGEQEGPGLVAETPAAEEEAPQESPEAYADPELFSGPLRLALLGRPNAGKSSLVNSLVGERRMIVSDMAGTTRDSVDVHTHIDGEPCTFVDTAGVRRRSKITDTVERYSVNSSLKSTSKAHVTLLVLDATEGLTLQDKRLIDLLHERKTPFIVLVNKMDLIEPKQRKATERLYKETLVFCPHVPLLFVSAKNGRDLKKITPLARAIRQECGTRISTGKLNRAMATVLERHQAPIVRRLRPKFFYLTQAESLPPTFVFFVNDAERVAPAYARYLERSLRALFGIRHAPMRVNFRSAHSGKNKRKTRSSERG